MIKFFVPGEPRAKQSFHYAGRGSFTPARIKAYQADVGWVAQQAMRAQGLYEPISHDQVLSAKIEFGLGDHRRIDLDNLNKAVFDGLNKIVFEDDHQVFDLHLRKRVVQEPGVQVLVGSEDEINRNIFLELLKVLDQNFVEEAIYTMRDMESVIK